MSSMQKLFDRLAEARDRYVAKSRLGGEINVDPYIGADLRSLAALRIGLAASVLINLMARFPDIRPFFSDYGILPRSEAVYVTTNPVSFSLHLFSGEVLWVQILFIIHMLFAVSMLVGYRSRLCTFVVWILCVSLFARNPMVTHRGDTLLAILLFWGLFVPWGARFSLDALRASMPRKLPESVTSIGTIALVTQIPLTLIFAAWLKTTHPSWTTDYSAVFYALSPEYSTWLGKLIIENSSYEMTQYMTIASLYTEFILPLFLFFPFAGTLGRLLGFDLLGYIRIVVILILVVFQGSLAIAMSVGIFPWIGAVGLIALVPPLFWNKFFPSTRRAIDPDAKLDNPYDIQTRSPVRTRLAASATAVLCLIMLTFALCSHLHSVNVIALHHSLNDGMRAFYLNQNWRMFVRPYLRSEHVTAIGELADGREVNLFAGLGPFHVDFDSVPTLAPPELPRADKYYASYRWRLYFQRLRNTNKEQLSNYARYLREEWNEHHRLEPRLIGIRIYHVIEMADRRDPESRIDPTTTPIAPLFESRAPSASSQ